MPKIKQLIKKFFFDFKHVDIEYGIWCEHIGKSICDGSVCWIKKDGPIVFMDQVECEMCGKERPKQGDRNKES